MKGPKLQTGGERAVARGVKQPPGATQASVGKKKKKQRRVRQGCREVPWGAGRSRGVLVRREPNFQ